MLGITFYFYNHKEWEKLLYDVWYHGDWWCEYDHQYMLPH